MPSSTSVFFRDVEVDGARTNVRVAGTLIARVGPATEATPGDEIVDGDGRALLPGLIDHHIHLFAAAAARTSVDLAGSSNLSPLRSAPGQGWVRAVGAGIETDRYDVDGFVSHRPARVQHRSGALWTLNSAAIKLLAIHLSDDERSNGKLWRADDRLRAALGDAPIDLVGLGADLLQYGVTHLTDASPDLDAAGLRLLQTAMPQRIGSLSEVGAPLPRKIVVPDNDLPRLDDLVAAMDRQHANGRPVALHVVTQVAMALVLAAFHHVGSMQGDRVEHAAVCDDVSANQLAALGVTVVTQPGLWTRNGSTFLRQSDQHDRPLLWRHAGLIKAGVRVAVGSDAPYGPLNPWQIIRSAVTRRLDDGTVGGPDERLGAAAALHTLLTRPEEPAGAPRGITAGEPADLALLSDPLKLALDNVTAGTDNPVSATMINGRFR
jgi:predicted amidohydrolase YtcJ